MSGCWLVLGTVLGGAQDATNGAALLGAHRPGRRRSRWRGLGQILAQKEVRMTRRIVDFAAVLLIAAALVEDGSLEVPRIQLRPAAAASARLLFSCRQQSRAKAASRRSSSTHMVSTVNHFHTSTVDPVQPPTSRSPWYA